MKHHNRVNIRFISGESSAFFTQSILSTWQAGINSGGKYGCNSYEHNPQYLIAFNEPDICK